MARPIDPQQLGQAVAQAIHRKATDGAEDWASLTQEEQHDFLLIALAAMEAHDKWLIDNHFRILPPGTLPRPKTIEEASSMVVAGREYLKANPPPKRLIVPRRGIQTLN